MRWRSLVRRRKAPNEPKKAQPDIVILIHGTGAAEPDPVTPKWWEPASSFAEDLRRRLGPNYDVGQSEESAPFKWSGANSEKDRRSAGRQLAKRLRALEKQERTYHLVGHSHGGSVIWHALWQSAGRTDRMPGLKSWTSVGTPFLEFAPVWLGLTTIIATIIVGAFLSYPLSTLRTFIFEQEVIFRDGNPFGVGVTIALGAVLLLLFFTLLYSSLRWLVRCWQIWRQRRAERRAVGHFADRWLAIWHAEDEPIAGLNASLITPLEFVPRLAKPTSNIFRRIITAPYNRLVAATTDEFVWSILMQRLQGADVGGAMMVDAGAAPKPLAPGWQSMPPAVAADMVMSAGNQAPRTIESLRKKLAGMRGQGRGNEAFGELSSAITWSEILHTSYFDIPSVRDLISARIRSAANTDEAAAPEKGMALETWLSERPQAEPWNWPKPFKPVLLSFAKIAVYAGLGMLLLTGFKASYDAYVAPNTRDGQFNVLAENATTRRAMAGSKASLLGDVLVRLDILGKLPDPKSVLEKIGDIDTRAWAGQRLAYHYGQANRFDAIAPLVQDAASLPVRNPGDAVAFVYVQALAGTDQSLAKPPEKFLDEAALAIGIVPATGADNRKAGIFSDDFSLSYPWLVTALKQMKKFNHQPSLAHSDALLGKMFSSYWLTPEYLDNPEHQKSMNCRILADAAALYPADKLPPNAATVVATCKQKMVTPYAAAGGAEVDAIIAAARTAGSACPAEPELKVVGTRSDFGTRLWSQSTPFFKALIDRNCIKEAAGLVRRHLPVPAPNYQPAVAGPELLSIAKLFADKDDETAALIAKFNLARAPAMVVPSFSLFAFFDFNKFKNDRTLINTRYCLKVCTPDDLRKTAERFVATAKLPYKNPGESEFDYDKFRVDDEAIYLLAAAVIYADLGDDTAAIAQARSALDATKKVTKVDKAYRTAAKISLLLQNRLANELSRRALAVSEQLLYAGSQSGDNVARAALQNLLLSDSLARDREFRNAREAAERASTFYTAVDALEEDPDAPMQEMRLSVPHIETDDESAATMAGYLLILNAALFETHDLMGDGIAENLSTYLKLSQNNRPPLRALAKLD